MNFLLGILFGILGILLVVVIKLSTTFFHELGHAFPALLFTDKSVKVYIGSYGDISNTTNFEWGRLKIYFKWNILDWKIGMCQHEAKDLTNWQNILIILGGPIASLLISLPLFFHLQSIQENSLLFFICVVFIAAAVYDLVINLFPFSGSIQMHDGSVAYSDGVTLKMLLSRSAQPKAFFELESMYQNKDYNGVIEKAQEVINSPGKSRFATDFLIAAKTELNDYTGALEAYITLKSKQELEDVDYFEIGKLYKSTNNYQEALKYFNHFRHKQYNNVELLHELGLLHLDMGNEKKALEISKIMISIKENEFYAPAHFLKCKALTMMEEFSAALEELSLLEKFSPDDPLIFYQYGLVYEDLNRPKLALKNFVKAKSLDCVEHGLDFKIEDMKSRV